MSEKINKSFLTEEAKSDINEMLDNNSGGGGSFTTQIETSEGLTLGKGTVNEESLTAEELTAMKNVNGIPSVNLVSADLTGIISLPQTIPANKIGSVTGSKQVTGLTPNSKYAILGIYVSGGQTGAHIVGGIHSMNTFTTDATGEGTLTFTILVSNDTNADISVSSSTLSGGYSISIMEYK